MFSRPIPGITPTEVIHTRQQRNDYKKNKTLEKLIGAAGDMLEERASFSVSTLAERAGSARRTVHKYWQSIIDALGVQWVDLPCLQPLANGGWQSVKVYLAVNEEARQELKKQLENARINGRSQRYSSTIIANGSTVDLAIPADFEIDISKLPIPAKEQIKEAQPQTEPSVDHEPSPIVQPIRLPTVIQADISPLDRRIMCERYLKPDDIDHIRQYRLGQSQYYRHRQFKKERTIAPGEIKTKYDLIRWQDEPLDKADAIKTDSTGWAAT